MLKIKLRYFQKFLGVRIGPPKEDRLGGGGLSGPCDLEKWKTSVFDYFTMRLNLSKRLDITL